REAAERELAAAAPPERAALLALGAGAALSRGDVARAAQRLARIELAAGGPLTRLAVRLLEAWRACLQARWGEAEMLLELCMQGPPARGAGLALALGRCDLAWVRHVRGYPAEARVLIDALLAEAALRAHPLLHCKARMLRAAMCLAGDEPARADEDLRVALGLSRRHGMLDWPGWLPGPMAALMAHALARDIEPGQATALIRARGLAAPHAGTPRWPWRVEIRAMGGLQLSSGGQPVAQSARGNRRTLDLLRAILAHDGRAVPIERLAGELWPDAEGDAAKGAFDVSLHRLRKFLGGHDLIRVSNGRVSLDPGLCGLDLWHLLDACAAAAQVRDEAAAGGAARDLLAAYGGSFLADEGDQPWLLAQRARLRKRFAQAVEGLGRLLEPARPEAAAGLYRQALELEPEADGLARRLAALVPA
ncbi:MAG: hypothetical protein REI09_14615, partial [Candidatus Dactylopiibacterium sp.]|nr:hypothetical protein [Candidatus Dactylopiibacterium sp.]